MTSAKSFSEYLQKKYYSDFYNAVEKHLYENPDDAFRKISDADSYELEDLRIQKTYLYRCGDTRIKVDCVFEADLEVSQHVHKYSESESTTEWFMITCTGNLAKNLEDFAIEDVQVYSERSQESGFLSDSLVPYIKESDFDSVALEILEKYYPEAAGKEACRIYAQELARRMGLQVIERHMSEDCSVFGQIFFADSEVEFLDDEGHKYKEKIKAGTVVYDSRTHYMRSYGNNAFTVIHECVHWYLHRHAYELEHIFNGNVARIQCETTGIIREGGFRSSTDWMEWQANGIAACILMPEKQFRIAEHRAQDLFIIEKKDIHLVDVMPQIIDALAETYGVSKQAVRIRLIDLGITDAAGAYDWFDGKYMRPYAFSKEVNPGNTTFNIGFKDFICQTFFSPSVKEEVNKGSYVYVESHVCLNDTKYIEGTDKGLRLTDYARYHMDECCLAFGVSIAEGRSYGRQMLSRCSLFRAFENLSLDIKLLADENTSVEKKAKELSRFIGRKENKDEKDTLHDIFVHLPDDFGETLDTLLRIQETTIMDLEYETGLANKTINDMKHKKRRTPKNGVAICIGLKLPPLWSEKLLHTLGIQLQVSDEEELLYAHILQTMYMDDIRNINEMLINMGYSPLTPKTWSSN